MDSSTGTIIILCSGIVVVVGSILLLRLHAFLALVMAAFLVAVLTPHSALERYLLQQAGHLVRKLDDQIVIEAGASQGIAPGLRYVLLNYDEQSKTYSEAGRVEVLDYVAGERDADWATIRLMDDATIGEKSLAIEPAAFRSAKKSAAATIGSRVATGFGNTCLKIGILIAMASIIGKCLLDSGAADRIVRSALNLFGERAAPVAFMFSGFLLGVPVFFDTVFYLMVPLGKALRVRTGRNYLLYVLTIVCGATMAHSLVPPTPGPLLVAEELGVDLGTMILVGGIVGLFAAAFGYLFATLANRWFELPLRESPDFSLADLEESIKVSDDELPALWVALLPIVLPVILIAMQTIIPSSALDSRSQLLVKTFGDKNIALTIAAIIAMATLVYYKRRSFQDLSTSIQAALASAGVIILITSAGGAFGNVLRQTGIAELIESLPNTSPVVICTLSFLITTAIRTAQGSASVAMITAAGILSGIVHSGDLGFHPVYIAAAIGCGSKPIAWMNDSGFWVITKMSGMTESEGLKYITPMTGMMGLVGLGVVLIGVTFFPNLI